LPASTTDWDMERRARHRTRSPAGPGTHAAVLVIIAVALLLPLMMGNRTPLALTASQLVLVSGALLAGILATLPLRGALPPPGRIWIVFFAVFTGYAGLQVLPIPVLAQAFGPYPEALWQHSDFSPRHWSPDIGATLRGWAAFVALFTIAWVAHGMRSSQRNVLWLALASMAVFQAIYGVTAHASGADTIFGIWPRNTPHAVHGSFSNYNLFAAYLALLWPLSVAVWWIREMPLLGRLPRELKFAGSLMTSVVIGAALFASTSRLGSGAAVVGAAVGLLLWSRYRHRLHGAFVWPAYLAFGAGLFAAAWYGLTPLAERMLATGTHDMRFEVLGLVRTELPLSWYLHGVGLGGFEAMFKQIQPGHMTFWVDYAHSDLLQWVVEMGIVGVLLLLAVIVGLVRAAHLSIERVALYAGLAALALVGLGDFSWHMPATQTVLAIFLGTLLRGRSRTSRRSG
jgi:putative inorganic carbon (hco3(-)) transporter